MHPLEVGTRARCQREGATHACEIIERASALVEDGPEAATVRWTYYVHYDGLNRRLDEWVPGERLHVEDEVGAGGGRGVGACPLARSPSSCTAESVPLRTRQSASGFRSLLYMPAPVVTAGVSRLACCIASRKMCFQHFSTCS